jgi:hypothetical protein
LRSLGLRAPNCPNCLKHWETWLFVRVRPNTNQPPSPLHPGISFIIYFSFIFTQNFVATCLGCFYSFLLWDRIGLEWAGLTKILKMDWNGMVVGCWCGLIFCSAFFWRLIFSFFWSFSGVQRAVSKNLFGLFFGVLHSGWF